jgi:hypothetical protein
MTKKFIISWISYENLAMKCLNVLVGVVTCGITTWWYDNRTEQKNNLLAYGIEPAPSGFRTAVSFFHLITEAEHFGYITGVGGLILVLTKLHEYFHPRVLYMIELIISFLSLIILYITWAYHGLWKKWTSNMEHKGPYIFLYLHQLMTRRFLAVQKAEKKRKYNE